MRTLPLSSSQLSEAQKKLVLEQLSRPDADAEAMLQALAASLSPLAWTTAKHRPAIAAWGGGIDVLLEAAEPIRARRVR